MYEELISSLRLCGKARSGHDFCATAHDGCCEAEPLCMYELMKQAADAIEVLSKPRWIPVAEEPPLKVGDDGYNGYLVYANGHYEAADYAIDKFDNVPYFHVNGEWESDVTHYMPLPEPPKEDDNE